MCVCSRPFFVIMVRFVTAVVFGDGDGGGGVYLIFLDKILFTLRQRLFTLNNNERNVSRQP